MRGEGYQMVYSEHGLQSHIIVNLTKKFDTCMLVLLDSIIMPQITKITPGYLKNVT